MAGLALLHRRPSAGGLSQLLPGWWQRQAVAAAAQVDRQLSALCQRTCAVAMQLDAPLAF